MTCSVHSKRSAARAAVVAASLSCVWSTLAAPQSTSSAWSKSRWWAAAGIGGTEVPPAHDQAIILAAEIGAARGPVELVVHTSGGRPFGGSKRTGAALMLGASGAAKFAAAHASIGAGRVSGCNQAGEASPCVVVPDMTGVAFRIGVDIFAAGALGLQWRYQGIGGGSQPYRPMTVGVIVGRLVPDPPWDRR